MPRSIHTIGQHLTSELIAWLADLRARALVYSHSTTADFLSAARLAQLSGSYDAFGPAAVVWLQVRPGEIRQAEIDGVLIADPLVKPFIIAGTLCEGEPRSGNLLADVTRFYWHQRPDQLLGQFAQLPSRAPEVPAPWITIHVRQLNDYQCLAGICQALGCRTIWQGDQSLAIASEPDIRLFWGWPAWEAWQSQANQPTDPPAPAILLLDFPRRADFVRAQAENITRLLAAPCRIAELGQALDACHRFSKRNRTAASTPPALPRAYRLTA